MTLLFTLYPYPKKDKIAFKDKSYFRTNSTTKEVDVKVAILSLKGSILAVVESTKNFFANSITNLFLERIDLAKPALTPNFFSKER